MCGLGEGIGSLREKKGASVLDDNVCGEVWTVGFVRMASGFESGSAVVDVDIDEDDGLSLCEEMMP